MVHKFNKKFALPLLSLVLTSQLVFAQDNIGSISSRDMVTSPGIAVTTTGTSAVPATGTTGIGANVNTAGLGILSNAAVPQYWITDASIFAINAANTALGMLNESELSVQDVNVFGNQAQFLNSAINRANSDLQSLMQSVNTTNPSVVPQVKDAIAQLTAAADQAKQLLSVSSQGNLGPSYMTSIQSTVDHLMAAQESLTAIAQAFNPQVATPSTGGATTGAGASNPTAGASNPTAGASNPSAGASNPAAGASNPAAGASNPAAGASSPAAGANIPASGTGART